MSRGKLHLLPYIQGCGNEDHDLIYQSGPNPLQAWFWKKKEFLKEIFFMDKRKKGIKLHFRERFMYLCRKLHLMFIVQTLRGTHFILTNVVFNLEWLLRLYDTCITPSKYFKKWGLSVDHFCSIYVWQTYKLYSVCVCMYSIHYLKKLNFYNRFSEYTS